MKFYGMAGYESVTNQLDFEWPCRSRSLIVKRFLSFLWLTEFSVVVESAAKIKILFIQFIK